METKAGTPRNPRLLEVRQETSKEDTDVRGKPSSWGPPHGRGPRASSVLDTTRVCTHRTGFVSLANADRVNPRQSRVSGTEEQMPSLKLVC